MKWSGQTQRKMGYGQSYGAKGRVHGGRNASYRRLEREKTSWGLWDILFLQLLFCLLLGLSLLWEPQWLLSWRQQAEADPGVTLLPEWIEGLWQVGEQGTELVSSLWEHLGVWLEPYLYEDTSKEKVTEEQDKALLPMGGDYPQEQSHLQKQVTLQPVMTTATLTAPLNGLITSRFGVREHPISGEEDFHTGLDLAAAEGSAIHLLADGVVTEAAQSPSYGNYLVVRHSENFQSKYAHCSRLLVQEGDVLRKGERIALVGSTGLSTGPHLHLETIVEGLRCDPLWLLPL